MRWLMRGGPGFTPFITFSSNGQPFTVTEEKGTSAQRFRASVPVRDPETGNVSGQLSFTLNQGDGGQCRQTGRRGIRTGRDVADQWAERDGCTVRNVATGAESPALFPVTDEPEFWKWHECGG